MSAWRFVRAGRRSGFVNRGREPKLACMAVAVALQQRASFGDVIDLREAKCGDCGGAGFNTGWGYLLFECGAERLSDGEPGGEPCSKAATTPFLERNSPL